MTFFDRAREAAERAAQQAREAADRVGEKMADPATTASAQMRVAQAGLQARRAGAAARRGFTTLIEKIDPRLLADVIIKSTALQEKTNLALREKGSAYRVGEVQIVAAIPPQVSFSITRVDEVEERISGEATSSSELVQATDDSAARVVALDGGTAADELLGEGADAETQPPP